MEEGKDFGSTIEALKSMLTDLQPCRSDFSIEIVAGKKIISTRSFKLGDYDGTTHRIRIFSNRCPSAKQVLETVIHEYAHHLMWEEYHLGALKQRVVHGKPFWDCYFKLMQTAKIKGVFDNEKKSDDAPDFVTLRFINIFQFLSI